MPLWVKKGTLKFPKDKDIPVIMVGPGTGVAPFRSALQERIPEGKHSTQWFVFYSDLTSRLRFPVRYLIVFLPLSKYLVLRLSLWVQRLLLPFRMGEGRKDGTPDPVHCLLTRPGQKDVLISNRFFLKWQVIICSRFQVCMVCLTTVKFIHMTTWDQIVSEVC